MKLTLSGISKRFQLGVFGDFQTFRKDEKIISWPHGSDNYL